MPNWLYKTLQALRIVARCPNCESAWTGGCPNPEELTHCLVCGDQHGKITGWVWGPLVDPFCWIGRRTVDRNLKTYNADKALWNPNRTDL